MKKMLIARKKRLLKAVEGLLETKRPHVEQARNSMRERIEQTIGSWSAAGDRAHAENAFEIVNKSLRDLEKLYDEISRCPDSQSDKAVPPCYVVLQTSEKMSEFYLVGTPVKVPGFR